MNRSEGARPMFAVTLLGLLVVACGPDDIGGADPGTWVGTITTEGNVTTVINESGSVWGGTARLVEEASIGVESGEEPYLLGNVVGVGVADDRIYLLDGQVHLVRAYDMDGRHLMDFGGEGDGPAEFRRPTGLAVGPQRVYVRDPQIGRVTVFSLAGELIDTWPHEPYFTDEPMVATTSGELFVPHRGIVPWGPDGAAGAALPFPEAARPPTMMVQVTEGVPGFSPGATLFRTVPFVAQPTMALSPSGAMIHGSAEAYAFTIEVPGGPRIRVERAGDPVPVGEQEAAWHRERISAYLRQAEPGWQWDGPEVPPVKPPYDGFVPAVTGEVWVLRPGPGYQDTECEAQCCVEEAPASCWKDERIIEAFDAEGRFLGQIDVPSAIRFRPRPVIVGNDVVGIVEDEAGTIMVKRYRLVLPGEE